MFRVSYINNLTDEILQKGGFESDKAAYEPGQQDNRYKAPNMERGTAKLPRNRKILTAAEDARPLYTGGGFRDKGAPAKVSPPSGVSVSGARLKPIAGGYIRQLSKNKEVLKCII